MIRTEEIDAEFSPGDVSIKGRNLRFELLVATDESVLVDLPDLAVVVPRREIVLEICGVALHPAVDQILDLLYFFVMSNELMDWLLSMTS
jgi:hypothetical protein